MNIATLAPTMTSLELVEFINQHRKSEAERVGAEFPSKGFAWLQHKHFLPKVLEVLGVETSAKFSADLPDSYGRPQPGYRFEKREACLMAMSYSYDLQAKVFDRMTALEAGAKPAPAFVIPQTYSAALRQCADQADQIEQQAAALALAAPKVEFVDRYVEGTGLKTFREVCKLLGAKENAFRTFLSGSGVMYRINGSWMPYASHIDAGRFVVKTGVAESNGHAFNTAKWTAKGVEWIAGLWAVHGLSVRTKELA